MKESQCWWLTTIISCRFYPPALRPPDVTITSVVNTILCKLSLNFLNFQEAKLFVNDRDRNHFSAEFSIDWFEKFPLYQIFCGNPRFSTQRFGKHSLLQAAKYVWKCCLNNITVQKSLIYQTRQFVKTNHISGICQVI